MKETYVIGIDYGTDSVRALLVDAATGETIADSVFSYPRWGRQEYCSPAEACFRQHPQDYLDGLRHVIGEVVAARPDAAPHIRAVSVDTTASTPCLVDRTCTPLALRPVVGLIEFFSFLLRPVTLALRLFGNMLGITDGELKQTLLIAGITLDRKSVV